MSRRVTTRTPILDRECLIEALESCNYQYDIQGDTIVVRAKGIAYNTIKYIQKNTYSSGKSSYSVKYEEYEHEKMVDSIESHYLKFYKAKLERLERERLEEEARKERERLEAYKQAQKEQIIAKAQQRGYKVKEVKKGDKIQLVCVRYT